MPRSPTWGCSRSGSISTSAPPFPLGGAAGGIATFNAPIAGPFFAMELILRDFAAESFGAVVLASVAASMIGRAAFGNHPFLDLPAFTLTSGWGYLLFARCSRRILTRRVV